MSQKAKSTHVLAQNKEFILSGPEKLKTGNNIYIVLEYTRIHSTATITGFQCLQSAQQLFIE